MFYQKVISVFCQEADSCHLINCPAELFIVPQKEQKSQKN